MNLPRILFGLILSAILISTVWSQEKKPKFVWSNIEQTYQSFDKFEPMVELQNIESILFETHPCSNLLMRYDEKEKKWIAGYCFLTDNMGEYSNLILAKNRPIGIPFAWTPFFGDSGNGNWRRVRSFISKNKKEYPMRGKYKIRFYYGTKPNKLNSYTESPEFILEADSLFF